RAFWMCLAALIVGALTTFRIEFLAGPIAFVVLSVPMTPLVADRWRMYAWRTQGIDGPPPWWVLSGAQAWIAGGMCLVAAVAIALVFIFRDPLSDRLHPDRCTAVPAATRAAI